MYKTSYNNINNFVIKGYNKVIKNAIKYLNI